MASDEQTQAQQRRRLWRRLLAGFAICLVLLIILHRPILLTTVRQLAIHYARKQNLRVDFRLEGEPLSDLTVRNLHVIPSGPSAIESVDIDWLHASYSLLGLLRHGFSHFLQAVQARGANVVLHPARAPPPKPHPKRKTRLPAAFPERIKLTDATLIIRNCPNDFVVENAELDLNPRAPGELRIGKLQLPSGAAWSKISGQTSYTSRNFILRNLVLSDQEQVRLLQIDASDIDAKALAIKLDCVAGGGKLSASVALNETASSLNTKANIAAEKVATESLHKFLFLPEHHLSGEIERLVLDGAGVIDVPRTWNGTMSLRVTGLRGPVHVDSGVVAISARQGKATIQSADIVQNQNEVHLRGTMELPETLANFGRTPTNLQISGKAPDLEQLTAELPLALTGAVQFHGGIDITNQDLQVALRVTGEAVGFSDGIIDKVNATVRASKNLARVNSKRPWFANLRTATEFTLAGIRYRSYVVDAVEGSLNSSEDVLGIDRLTVRRAANELNLRGRYRLPEHPGDALSQSLQLDVTLDGPEVGEFWVADSANKISGSLQASASIERQHGVTDGGASLSGWDLKMPELVVQRLSVQVAIAKNVVHLNQGSATLSATDFARATGTCDLKPPHRYSGNVSAHVENLAVLQPLLRVFGNQNQLAGTLNLSWEGEGQRATAAKAAAPWKNSGKLKLSLENGRYGNAQGLQANIDASYSPEALEVPTFFFATDNMDFRAIARAKGDRLEIDKIQLNQGQAGFASGYVSLPFVWSNLGTKTAVIPPSGKVSAKAQVESLDLKKLAADLGTKSSISGALTARLDAGGTVADLKAQLAVQILDLRNEQWQKMEPARCELSAQMAHDRLTVSGKLQQPRIQPLEVNAQMPLNVRRVLRDGKVPEETSIVAKARLPQSSLNFIRQLVPGVQQLDGQLGLDIAVSGTLGRPTLSGAADMRVNVARFTNATLPALRNFEAHCVFARDTLTLERFGGELAGGPFRMSGGITFPRLTQPTLNLQLKADSVLLARNDTLTARADADVKVTGPFAAATVTGNVALTNSHILKNIDLIPIGLPGRPAPQPPSARPQFSVTTPPLRDWRFDVVIKTKDPVLIRGNLATGGATSDLKLTGTGLHPQLQGVVQMQNVEATLPFSRLDVSRGLLTFNPSDPMNPQIDLEGTSVIRDYTVRVYVYGTVLSPQAIFTSEPPLPQEEIISLIATGATRQELSSGNVLAGRAAMLLMQQLYRKIVKKGEPTQSNTAFNRLDLQLGTVDPRTGQQQATVSFKINDQLVLTGDVGVRGDFRGRLKYLIRFR